MSDRIGKILSHDAGPFWQFVKYGAIGALATAVQAVAFYALAATVLRCLTPDDVAVRLLGLPAASISETVRALRFAAATALGFAVSNVLCWILNRAFVFRPGRYRWWTELALFVLVAATAMALATALGGVLIARCGLMTTLAVLVEIVVSFFFNFALRKFVIFKG
ncbi:MAG: GtrA family protein [Kiritimatiellae bacterium]|nr:GtrA family protein [Kiritimatiellia bacterium]